MKRKVKEISQNPKQKISNSLFQALIAIIAVLWVCQPALQNGFVNWDDNVYVYDNQLLVSGSAWEYISSVVQGNFHPITLLTLKMDHILFGLSPKGYHAHSLIWHFLNAVLAYFLMLRLSEDRTLSFLLSLGFALHPLHVESYAWISARKDLVYSAFTLFGLIAWYDYLDKAGWRNLMLSLLCLLLALLSKPMAVVMPLLMGLLLYMHPKGSNAAVRKQGFVWVGVACLPALLLAVWTIQLQGNEGAIRDIPNLGMHHNVMIAAHGIFFYLLKGIMPVSLSALYPYPPLASGLSWAFYAAPFGLVLLVFLLWKFRQKLQPILPGFAWMLICLLPVLQLIPAGSAIAADRYFYLAAFGFLWACTGALRHLPGQWGKYLFYGFCALWAVLSYRRVTVWQSGESLFRSILVEYPDNPTALNNLGDALDSGGKKTEVCSFFARAVEVKPDFPQALFNLAVCRSAAGDYVAAKQLNQQALRYKPGYADAWSNLGMCYGATGVYDSARYALDRALQYHPEFADAWANYGMLHLIEGRKDSAKYCFQKAMTIDQNPNSMAAYNLKLMEQE